MEKIIIENVDKYVKNDFSYLEKKKILNDVKKLLNNNLITEKNTSYNKNVPDAFNLGSYVIMKEKEAVGSMIGITANFKNKYMSDIEKTLVEISKEKKFNNQEINILILYYNQLKINVLDSKHFVKNISSYNIE